jgi:hypothetical protein
VSLPSVSIDKMSGMSPPRKAAPQRQDETGSAPQFDDVLRRLLSSPPQHKVKPKPADKPAQKKPAK